MPAQVDNRELSFTTLKRDFKKFLSATKPAFETYLTSSLHHLDIKGSLGKILRSQLHLQLIMTGSSPRTNI